MDLNSGELSNESVELFWVRQQKVLSTGEDPRIPLLSRIHVLPSKKQPCGAPFWGCTWSCFTLSQCNGCTYSKMRCGRFKYKGKCPDCGGKVFWVQNNSGGCATVWLGMWESRHQKENPGCWRYDLLLSLNCCRAEDGAVDVRVPTLVYTPETLQ